MSAAPTGPLRIGLLLCGHIHPDVAAATGGDYPEAFAELFAPHDLEIVTYDVTEGHLPAATDECDGWLVSGSADSTYDERSWIAPVEAFLRDLVTAEAPLVAVCFGHQLLAQAHGGRVAKADAGWGVGAHDYAFTEPLAPWMDPASPTLRLIASHQDQVVELPEGAVVLASTDHCPVAAFTLGPRAFAIQPHPEFTAEVSRGLVGLRRERIGADTSDAALASLDRPLDRDVAASWMASFLRG